MGLDIAGFGAIADVAKDLIDRFFPNKTEEEKAQMTLILTSMQGQLDTNKAEATNQSIFVSGWRPFVGWIGGTSLGLIYIPKALVLCALWSYQAYVLVAAWHGVGTPPTLPPYPDLGVTDLLGLLGSLLGFGWARTAEKFKGVAAS